jgi:Uma2 family endonuclease
MGTAALISVEEYLATSYRPDCDYVDGQLIERNLGTKDHSRVQGEILGWFRDRRHELRVRAFPEQRIRISPRRYRIPDVCVYAFPVPDEQVFTQPPYICFEILSPDDSLRTLRDRLDDYLTLGIPNIWAIDPATRRAWTITREGYLEALDAILRSTDGRVILSIADLFQPDEL